MHEDSLVIPATTDPRCWRYSPLDIQTVFRDGKDLMETKAKCKECTDQAPPHPTMPQKAQESEFPFSHIYTNILSADGTYLAICDMYSGWLLIYKFRKDNVQSRITPLRRHFLRYGITKELYIKG